MRLTTILKMLPVAGLLLWAKCGNGLVNGSISGTVMPGNTKPRSLHDFVAGDLIVKFKDTGVSLSGYILPQSPFPMTKVRELALPGVFLYHSPVSHEQTLELLEQVKGRSDIEFAQLNRIYHPTKVPTDPLYSEQWHYNNMNLPAAWDISTGVASTVVAVIDDGMLYNLSDTDPKTHPDFAGKVVGGYDFISDPAVAEDGDGRDANPYDNRGDQYHGTHVGGTVAAASNNGQFGAGVNWSAKLVNIRALGTGGGTGTDILEGMLWAGGEPVAGIPNNPNPAKVINMSLGGNGACDTVQQMAIDKLVAKGIIIVVAAGNETVNVNLPVQPASCNNVITVGATGPTNLRAPYSNFGARIDVMAPGGDTEQSINLNGQDKEAGVYSNFYNKQSMSFILGSSQGTSMAAPHVAGLVSLMVGIDPTLNHSKTLAFLKTNAKALPAADCSAGNAMVMGSDCGSGLVDAAKTLKAVKDALGGAVTPPPPAPPAPPAAKPTKDYVRAELVNDPSKSKQVEVMVSAANVPYNLPDLAPGTYKVTLFTDLNNNATLDAGEPSSSVEVTLASGEGKTGVDLTLQADE